LSFLFGSKSKEDKELDRFVRQLFGVKPKDLSLFRQALRHKSAATEIRKGVKDSNERLEYLGDAILDSIVARYLFEAYPYKNEGYLTKLRSRIVSRKSLNTLAEKLGLEAQLEVNIHQTIHHKSLLGNAFEAMIGALYLERGFEKTYRAVLNNVLKVYIDLSNLETTERNYKSKMLEWAQKSRKRVAFRVIKEEDLGYKKIYQVKLMLDGVELGNGTGSSKKEAEQGAAKMSWLQLFPELEVEN